MEKFYYETRRLILRHAEREDADRLAAMRSTPFVKEYNLYLDCDGSKIIRELDNYEYIVLIEKESGELIGCVSIREDDFRYHVDCRMLQAWLTEKMAYRGLMAEAIDVILAKLFYLDGMERASGQILAENRASLRMVEKLGFEREGYLKRALKDHNGKVHDLVLTSIDCEAYKATHKNPF